MLEDCKSFVECEQILSREMGQARYIAQVELSKKDLAILEGLINNSINSIGADKTKNRLKYRFPFCTAFFMVYKGIYEYYSGNYWSCLSSLPDISNPNSQSRWGEWFLKFLNEQKLAEFSEIERTYRYVTPILIHGGIPQICIEDFFEKIVVPLIEQGYQDSEEVIDFLYSYRIRQKEILRIENLIHKLKNQLYQLYKEKIYAEKLLECLNKLNSSSKMINPTEGKYKRWSFTEIRDFYEEKQRELEVLKSEIEKLKVKSEGLEKSIFHLEDIKNHCFEVVNLISHLNLYLSYIEKSKRQIRRLGILKANWQLCSNVSISHLYHINRKKSRMLYVERISEEYHKRLKNYILKLKNSINHILSICYLLLEEHNFNLQYKDVVHEVAASLENYDVITKETFETISRALENICISQEEIRNEVEKSKNLLWEKIKSKTEALRELNRDISEMENICRDFGDGYFDRGIERIPEWVSSHGEIRIEKNEKILSLEQELNKYQNNIKRLTCFAQYAEKTVQHFLYYGEDWAKQWLISGVELVLSAAKGEAMSDFEFYDYAVPTRFINAFYKWWQKQIDSNNEKTLQYSSTRTGQRFTTPVLCLDPVFGELKIVVGRQRVLIPEDAASPNLFITIEDKNNSDQSVSIPLKCYRTAEEGLVETKEIEYEIKHTLSKYVVILGTENDVYTTWEIEGIDTNIPFVVFNLKGMHISGNVCPKGQAWILMQNKYEFKSNIPVLEEMTPPALPAGYRLILADFTNVNSFSIGEKGEFDSGFMLGKVEVEDNRPYLVDTSYIPGLKISGALVYNEKLPRFAVPVDDEGSLEGWSMVIRKGKSLRKYIRLSELNYENLSLNNGYAIIDLKQIFNSTADLAGFYTIYIRNPLGEENNFEFTYMPDLFVGFDKDREVHFPSDEMDKAQVTLIFSPGISFTPELPAAVTEVVDEAYDIEVPWEEGQLIGEIAVNNGERFNFELELPNIKWKIQGFDQIQDGIWNIMDKEIWLDDEKFDKASLYISIPTIFENKAYYCEVGIRESDHYVIEKFTNNKALINLMEFSDTVNDDLKIHSFYIKIYDKKFKILGEGILFRIRNHWEVKNLKWESEIRDNKISLKIYWDDVGKAVDRVVQLWKCWKPWEPPLKYNISDGDNFVNIQEDRAYLEEGKYLIKFDTEDPWDEPVSADFPDVEDEDIHFIEVGDRAPWIKKWEFFYDSDGSIKIRGSVFGAEKGVEVECFLIGLVRGRPAVFKRSTELMDGGFFSITVPDKVMAKKWVHWLVIRGVDVPFYLASIVPDPSPIEIKVSKNFDINIIPSDMINYVKIIGGEQKSFKYSGSMVKNILDMYAGEKDEIDLRSNIYGKKQRLKLVYEDFRYFLMIENGVKCTSCGAIVESQAVWNQKHYPKCKSFIYKYTDKIKVNVVVGIDSEPAIKHMQKTYGATSLNHLELHSNIHNPEPKWGNMINSWIKDREELKYQVINLVKQEMNLFKMSVRGGELDER